MKPKQKIYIVIGGVGGEEIEVFSSLDAAQRYCGEMNTKRRRLNLQEAYDNHVVTRRLRNESETA